MPARRPSARTALLLPALLAVLALGGTGLGLTATPAAAAPIGCAARDPFPAGTAEALGRRYPGRRFTAQVYDQATGCTYDLAPGRRQTTASVVKLEIMVGVLLRAQQQGRGLTDGERSLIHPMITQSANDPASRLFTSLGGVPAMDRLSRTFGMTSTTSTSTWGLTETTAADQVRLVRQVLGGEPGPLSGRMRAEARNYTSLVVPTQRWGASATLQGRPDVFNVMQKNGFAGSRCCGWRLNTVGWVDRPGGRGYGIAILSDGWPDQASGVAAVDALGARVNRALVGEPVGQLDLLSTPPAPGGGRVRVEGWTADPHDDVPLEVHVYVDGAFAGKALADRPRADVGAAFPAFGPAHGFDLTVPVATDGLHRVCAFALNVGPGALNPSLGCGTVAVRTSPVTHVDLAHASDGVAELVGWAIDPDDEAPVQVELLVDGTTVAAGSASEARPDLEQAYGRGAAHGFRLRGPVGPGPHTACVRARNLGPGADVLGPCVRVDAAAP